MEQFVNVVEGRMLGEFPKTWILCSVHA